MSTTTQVSAYISEETKAEIEAYVKRRGVKKAYLIEEALLRSTTFRHCGRFQRI